MDSVKKSVAARALFITLYLPRRFITIYLHYTPSLIHRSDSRGIYMRALTYLSTCRQEPTKRKRDGYVNQLLNIIVV